MMHPNDRVWAVDCKVYRPNLRLLRLSISTNNKFLIMFQYTSRQRYY